MELFDPTHIYDSLLDILPPGETWIRAPQKDTNQNKLIRFFEDFLKEVCDIENKYYSGLLVTEGDFGLDRMREDLGLPNYDVQDISGYESERLAEVFVMQRLMRDNTPLGIQRVWNAFGVRVRVWSKDQYTVVVTKYAGLGDVFPLDFTISFDTGTTLAKLQYFTTQMIPAHCTVEFETANEEYIKHPYTDPDGEPEFQQFRLGGKDVEIRTYFNTVDNDQA